MGFRERLAEAIEGLPVSHDPYEPSSRTDTAAPHMQPPYSPEESPSDEPTMSDQGSLDDPGAADALGSELQQALAEEPGAEESDIPYWEPIPDLPNKIDLGWRRSDGFTLRARKLKFVNKWVAQLYKGDKVLDHGLVSIGDEEDPGEYLQRMSDYMLDNDSNRYRQTQIAITPEETPEEISPPPEELEQPDTEEEVGLDDDNFEFDDEVSPEGSLSLG